MEESSRKLSRDFLNFSALACISTYLVIRVVLSGLVAVSFWSLPADAYQELGWLSLVPQWS